jgi:hypothetical protein
MELSQVKIVVTLNGHSGQGVTAIACYRLGIQIQQNILRNLAATLYG